MTTSALFEKKSAGRPRNLVPKLYRHPDGGGFIVINGRHRRLGQFGSPECEAAYRAIVAEVLSGNVSIDHATPELITAQITTRTLGDLGDAFIAHCNETYVKAGKPTTHVTRVRTAFDIVRKAGFASTAITAFGPLALDKLRGMMVTATKRKMIRDAQGQPTGKSEAVIGADGKPVSLYSRETINKYVWCILQAFHWAVSREIIPESAYRSLKSLPALRKGRSAVQLREPKQGKPVSDAEIEAAIPHMSPTIATMVQVQRLVGMRPLEVRHMCPQDLTVVSPNLWIYRVAANAGKLAHLENIVREVPLGPRCIALLTPFMKGKAQDEYIFDSRDQQHAWKRGSKPTPYEQSSYAQAIERACIRAGIKHWSPNQLRHALATEVANGEELDTARRVLGHSKFETTLRYVRRADEKANSFARKRA